MKKILLILMVMLLVTGVCIAGDRDDRIKTAAREIVSASKYCTLISIGEDGYPNARTMDAFKPDIGWVIWMGTNGDSRKVKEILKNNRVSVFYESAGGNGYVLFKGNGFIVKDEKYKTRYFKEEWKEFYSAGRENFILIKFVPQILEVVSYKKGLLGKEKTWEAPSVLLNQN